MNIVETLTSSTALGAVIDAAAGGEWPMAVGLAIAVIIGGALRWRQVKMKAKAKSGE